MDDKIIIEQLKKLRQVRPDAGWQKTNREILMNQIYGPDTGNYVTAPKAVWTMPLRWLKAVPQPVLAVFVLVVILLTSGIVGIQAAKDSIPGDSLYIAKIINEKTQLALTFNDTKKAQLGLTFAGNRAEELRKVLDEPATESAEKSETVEKLVQNFKKEISDAKSRIARINAQQAPQAKQPAKTPAAAETPALAPAGEDTAASNTEVFAANLGRDDKGLEISEPAAPPATAVPGEAATMSEPVLPDTATATGTATGTPAAAEPAATDATKVIEEAQVLLGQKNYDETLTKLNEAGDLIDMVDVGQVKGEEETPTSTPATTTPEVNGEEDGQVLGVEEQASTTENVN